MIHTGTFRLSRRIDTEVGQNMSAAILSSLSTAALLAVLAKLMSRDVRAAAQSISIADFMVVSVIGAILSSIVVLVLTVAVAAFCAHRDLDLDNVAAPIVTAAGDMVTLPSLFLATYLLGFQLRHADHRDRVRGARHRRGRRRVSAPRRCRSCAASSSSRCRSSRSRASSTSSPASRSRSASTSFLKLPGAARPRAARSSRTPVRSVRSWRHASSTKLHLGTLGEDRARRGARRPTT